jgi:hypothetical protein
MARFAIAGEAARGRVIGDCMTVQIGDNAIARAFAGVTTRTIARNLTVV